MAATDLTVDRLGASDVDAARDLASRAGWSTSRAGWRRMVELGPVDAFAGRVDGRLVATATLVRYGTRVGWVGMMLVHPEHRRRGYGTRLLRACLDAAADAGVATVGLDANAEGRPLYDAEGFVPVAEVTQWRGSVRSSAVPEAVERVGTLADTTPVAAYDRRATGVDREFLLASLLEDEGTVGLVRRGHDGAVTGYALVLRRPPGWTVGPLVADGGGDVEALVRAASERVDGDSVTVNEVENQEAAERYRRLGLEPRRTLTRMTHREHAAPLAGERVRGIPAFEYG